MTGICPIGRNRSLPVTLALVLTVVGSYAQELRWSDARLSLTAQWVLPQKEFGEYWKSGPGLGTVADVPLNNNLRFVGVGSFSWHGPAESSRQARIPQILLFKLGLGLEVWHSYISVLEHSLGAALLNNTFIFSGPAAPDDIDNSVESEFGAAIFSRFSFEIRGLPPLGIVAAYESIFTGPEPVAMFSIGAVIPVN